jgi:hypothetical protein
MNTKLRSWTLTTRFEVKDSGKREEFASGMVRDTEEGKIKYHLIASGPMLKRWAKHLTSGAKKYSDDNWMKASGEEEYQRFRKSAFRHFMQWFQGDTDEDHAAAVYFNLNGAEFVREKRVPNWKPEESIDTLIRQSAKDLGL